jgi:hypothetical protein
VEGEDELVPPRQQRHEPRLHLVPFHLQDRAVEIVLVRPLRECLQRLLDRRGVPPGGALDDVGRDVARRCVVVAEQVELQLDGIELLEPLHEGGEGSRPRSVVDDPEQVSGHLHVPEPQGRHLPAHALRDPLELGLQPLGAEVERVVVRDVGDGADAHEDLGGLGRLDLDRQRRRTRQVEHRRPLIVFDSHGTHAAYSQFNGLTTR